MATQRFDIDPSHSSVGFTIRHLVIAKVHGSFTRFNGQLELDLGDFTKSTVRATVETASIDTREAQRDGHLKSVDFFDVEHFPELQFVSTSIEHKGGSEYSVHGDLSIRGVTRPVTLHADFAGEVKDPWGNDRVAFSAKTRIDRKDFGLVWNQKLDAGGVLVGEHVDISLEVEAKKA